MGLALSILVFLLIALVCGGLAGFFVGYRPLFSMMGAFTVSFIAILVLVFATPFDLGPIIPFEDWDQPLGTALLAGVLAALVAALVERLITKGRFEP